MKLLLLTLVILINVYWVPQKHKEKKGKETKMMEKKGKENPAVGRGIFILMNDPILGLPDLPLPLIP